MQSFVFGKNRSFHSSKSKNAFEITFASTRVQKPKCPITLRLSTASGPPRSGVDFQKTITSYDNCSLWRKPSLQLFLKRVLSWLYSTSPEGKKPECPTMSKLSAATLPSRSGLVINKTVSSCHICSQLSLSKTKVWTLFTERVLSWLPSLNNSAKSEASYRVKTINKFRSSTVFDSL